MEVLLASVRQASEGPVLPGRSGAKKVCGTFRPLSVSVDGTRLVQIVCDVAGDKRPGKESSAGRLRQAHRTPRPGASETPVQGSPIQHTWPFKSNAPCV